MPPRSRGALPSNRLIPDPRKFLQILVEELEVDSTEQRPIDPARVANIAAMADNWDWNKCEVITVHRSSSGRYKVVEGQGRTLALKMRDPQALMPCIVMPAQTTSSRAAQTGLAISQSRTRHNSLARWHLRSVSGEEHEKAAEKILEARGLALSNYPGPNVISAIHRVAGIIHSYGPLEGARVLAIIIDTLKEAYPDSQPDNAKQRWNQTLIRAVWQIYTRSENVDTHALAATLAARPAQQWISIQAEKTKTNELLNLMITAYNRRVKGHKRVSMP